MLLRCCAQLAAPAAALPAANFAPPFTLPPRVCCFVRRLPYCCCYPLHALSGMHPKKCPMLLSATPKRHSGCWVCWRAGSRQWVVGPTSWARTTPSQVAVAGLCVAAFCVCTCCQVSHRHSSWCGCGWRQGVSCACSSAFLVLSHTAAHVCMCACLPADIACFPWVNALSTFYKADDTLQLANFPTVKEWVARCMERPASKVGRRVVYVNHKIQVGDSWPWGGGRCLRVLRPPAFLCAAGAT
jgi:hypothetical protein